MSSISMGGVSASVVHTPRGPQQSSPLREKMHELVEAARNRPDVPTGMPADLSQSERLEKRIEQVETRAASVASNFETLATNMQSRLEVRAERAVENGNQERADHITGMAESLATRIETASDRINSHFEENIDRMRQRLEALYEAESGTSTPEEANTESTVDIQA